MCRNRYEEGLRKVSESAEEDDDLLLQNNYAPQEDEEEWEMLDKLREELQRVCVCLRVCVCMRHNNPPLMKQPPKVSAYYQMSITASSSGSVAAGPANQMPRPAGPSAVPHAAPKSKQALVSQIMVDTTLPPAERQRQVFERVRSCVCEEGDGGRFYTRTPHERRRESCWCADAGMN